MSGSRANAAAIQRRTNASQAPPPVQKGRPNMKPNSQPPQAPPKPPVRPKISVSDAIALTTLRLGRVEHFINNLPPLDQIGNSSSSSSSGPELSEGLRVVDEALFNNIVSRLEKLEANHLSKTQQISVFSKNLETFKKDVNRELAHIRFLLEQQQQQQEKQDEVQEPEEPEQEQQQQEEFVEESVELEIQEKN
jgi:hypothetical protein